MLNYIKFAIFQILSFSTVIFHTKELKKEHHNIKVAHNFLKKHAQNSLKLVKINVDIKGLEKIPNEPVLFVSNHASMLDGFILLSTINVPCGYVIADEAVWKNMIVINKLAKILKSVYINRKDAKKGMLAINEASQNIINGQSMVIFPEGDLTWVKDENAKISEFKSGALKIAYKAKCKIVPVVIKNSKNTYEGFYPIGKINSKDVFVEVLDPFDVHLKNSKIKTKELGEIIRNEMIKKMI